MKRKLVVLFLALSGLAVNAESAGNGNTPSRDAAGFLTVPPPLPPASAATDIGLTSTATTSTTTTNEDGEVSSITTYILDDKHTLMAGDRVSFLVKEDQTNAVPLIVAESTELDVPYIGRVSVADKTCKQLAAELEIALERDYYHEATVIIGLDMMAKTVGKVLVIGQVNTPGPVDIPPNEEFTVGKAILKAGGFKDFANKKEVKIIRKAADGSKKTIPVNMKRVFEDEKIEEDVAVKPDDWIVVPKRGVNIF